MLKKFIYSNKARIGLLAIIAICMLAVGCGASDTTPEPTPTPTSGECSVEDIRDSEIFSHAFYLLVEDKHPTDEMSFFLLVEHELSDDEIQQIEQLGVTIDKDSWKPPPEGDPYGGYQVRSKVEDICKLIGVDSIIKVWSPLEEMDGYYPQ